MFETSVFHTSWFCVVNSLLFRAYKNKHVLLSLYFSWWQNTHMATFSNHCFPMLQPQAQSKLAIKENKENQKLLNIFFFLLSEKQQSLSLQKQLLLYSHVFRHIQQVFVKHQSVTLHLHYSLFVHVPLVVCSTFHPEIL